MTAIEHVHAVSGVELRLRRSGLLVVALLAHAVALPAASETSGGPETVVVQSGALRLRALLWRPEGRGPFPAVLFNHGSGPAESSLGPRRTALGPLFARHGYVFLFLFRRGSGLSAGEGTNSFDLMRRESAEKGQEARNRLQMRLLEGDDLSDVLAGLAFLRARPEVDPRRVAVAGHSFGGSLALLVAERDSGLWAVIDFAGAAYSWPRSAQLRERLLAAVGKTAAPIFIIHAANDYCVAPAEVLAAEMARLGKPHRVKIYPPFGRTAEEGHDFVYHGAATWGPDVFAFLNERTER